jgi:hypothetical protein
MPKTQTVRRRLIMIWFAIDAIVAMLPPLYWMADGQTAPILGVPGALFYFLAVSACITTSLIAAHLTDREPGL